MSGFSEAGLGQRNEHQRWWLGTAIAVVAIVAVCFWSGSVLSSPRGLHAASRAGEVERIRDLLRAGSNPDAEQPLLFDKASLRHTPLLWAIRGKHVDAVEVLIAGGADVNKPVKGRSLLEWALLEGSDTVALALLRQPGIDLQVENSSPEKALYWAITYDRDGAVRELVERGADFRRADRYGVTGVELACGKVGTRRSEAAIDAMLDNGLAGDELCAPRFKDGQTILMFACGNCSLEVVTKALRSARDVRTVDSSGCDAAAYARKRTDGQEAGVLGLLENSASK